MSKLDKIKTHFRENKKLYVGIAIGAGVTIVAVSTCIILRSSTSEVGNDFRVSPRGVFYKSPSSNASIFASRPSEILETSFRIRQLEPSTPRRGKPLGNWD